jgi:SAM-dependent methyltransferase
VSGPDRHAAAILAAVARRELPARIAYMRLAMDAASPGELAATLAAAAGGEEVAPVLVVAAAHPDGWRVVHSVLAEVSHEPQAGDPGAQVARIAAMFDRAAAISPEASVALYSLGDPAALAQATGEVVAWLMARGVLGREKRLLDLGCGIGRLAMAVAGEVGRVTGIDVSAAMVAEARRRCAGLANVEVRQTGGSDLAGFGDAGFDGVVALDSFPYVVAAGGDLARRMVAEAGRVLVPGGSLVVFNYAYRGDTARDRAELTASGEPVGLRLVEVDPRPCPNWDGVAYRLVRS